MTGKRSELIGDGSGLTVKRSELIVMGAGDYTGDGASSKRIKCNAQNEKQNIKMNPFPRKRDTIDVLSYDIVWLSLY